MKNKRKRNKVKKKDEWRRNEKGTLISERITVDGEKKEKTMIRERMNEEERKKEWDYAPLLMLMIIQV